MTGKLSSNLQWDDLALLLAICRAGTLSGAAKSLQVNHSTVFRRLNAIEEKMGVRFFERLAHGYAMTEAGEAVMRAAERIDSEVHGLSRELLGRDLRLQGKIRVTAPEGISLFLLSPLLNRFCIQHPDIRIDLAITSSHLELARREADLAVRVTGAPPDASLGRRLCRFAVGFYASGEYLKKNPHGRLEDYDWLITQGSIERLPPTVWNPGSRQQARIVMSSDNSRLLVQAAEAGLGVIPLPCFWGDGYTQLVRVIDEPDELIWDLWLLTHPDLRKTARVRALMTFLYEELQDSVALIEGHLPRGTAEGSRS
jgi:DNA-binding transcriptional LysR family regulator